MYCIYKRNVELCPDVRTEMPVGYLNKKSEYECYKCGFLTIQDAQTYLIQNGAIVRHDVKPKDKCIDCVEYIIIASNFESLDEKIVPSYIKC